MKNRILSLVVSVVMVLSLLMVLPVSGETGEMESSQGVLTFEEIYQYAETMRQKAMLSSQILNNPEDEEYNTDDGYMIVYDFATFYCDSPVITPDTVINDIVITSEETDAPRDVKVDDTLPKLLGSYYSENPMLKGDKSFAGLYSCSLLPDEAYWGMVQREGQNVQSVQYVVHDQLQTGAGDYTDCGIVYTIQDMSVGAIRIYGIGSTATELQVRENIAQTDALLEMDAYSRVKSVRFGDTVEKFAASDLIFSGIDFVSLTPEDAQAAFGTVLEDQWMENDGSGIMRAMDFADCSVIFMYDSSRQNCHVHAITIFGNDVEGPRCIRLGDSVTDVISRFPADEEAELDSVENGTTQQLYGDDTSAQSGNAEYYYDGTATLRYNCLADDGTPVCLYVSFTMYGVDEILVYVKD